MTTANYITRTELREELQEALKPIERRLETVEGHLRDVQEDVKAIKDFLMPTPPEDGHDGD